MMPYIAPDDCRREMWIDPFSVHDSLSHNCSYGLSYIRQGHQLKGAYKGDSPRPLHGIGRPQQRHRWRRFGRVLRISFIGSLVPYPVIIRGVAGVSQKSKFSARVYAFTLDSPLPLRTYELA